MPKFIYDDSELACAKCGGEAIGEDDLYTGELPPATTTATLADTPIYYADDLRLRSPHFYPCTALCASCLLLHVPPVPGPWYEIGVGGQA